MLTHRLAPSVTPECSSAPPGPSPGIPNRRGLGLRFRDTDHFYCLTRSPSHDIFHGKCTSVQPPDVTGPAGPCFVSTRVSHGDHQVGSHWEGGVLASCTPGGRVLGTPGVRGSGVRPCLAPAGACPLRALCPSTAATVVLHSNKPRRAPCGEWRREPFRVKNSSSGPGAWHTSVIQGLRRLRQKDLKLRALREALSNSVSLCLIKCKAGLGMWLEVEWPWV